MMKFLCFAYDDEEQLNALSHEEWLTLRSEVLNYVDALRERGTLIATHPLQTVRRATTVRVRNGRSEVTDGPFAEAKEHIGGYFLIEVADREEALRVAAQRGPAGRDSDRGGGADLDRRRNAHGRLSSA